MDSKEIIVNGLWKQNPGVVQLLGMCPTLAVTSTLVWPNETRHEPSA